jgi:hypothetical protein
MSSSPSSFTEPSDISPPSSSSTHNDPPSTFTSYRDCSGNDIFQEMKALRPQGIFYIGEHDPNLNSQCEFIYNKTMKGDLLISKARPDSEFLFTGIFQIDARSFFMTSDGKWNAGNTLGTRLEQVKPTCRLLPVVRNSDFQFSTDHFPTVTTNLRAIENMANPRKGREHLSILIDEPGQPTAIKLSHQLFVVCHLLFPFNLSVLKIYHNKDKNISVDTNNDCMSTFIHSQNHIFISLRLSHKRMAGPII